MFGFEYMDELVDNGVFSVEYGNELNCLIGGCCGVFESYCLFDGDGNMVDNINSLMGK